MKKSDFIKCIMEFVHDVTFLYGGKKCGLCFDVINGKFSFQAWCGEDIKEYGQISIETVMQDKFFDGKSINELLETVEFYFT